MGASFLSAARPPFAVAEVGATAEDPVMDLQAIFSSHFTWGLLVGLFFAGMALWSHFKTFMEFRRYKKLLGDKMELEADQYRKIKEDRERLGQENENLRLKVGSSKENPTRDLERELEIFARAEKRMMINAPGFAGAWEAAKGASHDELVEEERGKSLPKKFSGVSSGATLRPSARWPRWSRNPTAAASLPALQWAASRRGSARSRRYMS